ncbi:MULTISPECIES: MFS transporter [unclassified Streptomyces]|uniref:MFS transporter n=1 Tax=unclassified Streptomyces TaxID=2593676 RepID=UPI00236635B9|nr:MULTISPECIES: MFS transporter [unclassified Streptomyces]MDF3146660.1 MFS transporter [Streptomyces sp. T21Q-yed]WDF36070.1 MFS transporter [Streptomyces sp. T12]
MSARSASALTFGVAVALTAGVTLGNGGANVMPVFVDDFASRFGLSDSGAGLVAATQLMTTAVVTLLLAKRAARPGRVRMTRLGLALSGAGFLGAAAATDPVTLVLANLVLGAGLGAVYAAATAALAATDDADKASAVTNSGVVGVTALLIMGVPAANHDLGEGTGFLLMALCCLVAWPLVRRLPDGPATPGAASAGTVVTTTAKPSVVLLLGTALLWTVTQGAWSYASVLGRQHTGLSHSAVSAVLAISSVVALVGAAVGPMAARRFGRMRSMAVFVTAQALAMAALVLTHDPVLFTVAAVLWQACQLAVLVQMLAAAALIDPTGRLVASLSGAGALGTGIGPLAVGAVLDAAGADVLGIVLALGTVIASLPLLRMTVAGTKASAEHKLAPSAAETG